MNQGGTPAATSPPIMDPAEVPTIRSALAGSHRVSEARASRPPVSQAPPRTPPAPSTRPTRLGDLSEVFARVAIRYEGETPAPYPRTPFAFPLEMGAKPGWAM